MNGNITLQHFHIWTSSIHLHIIFIHFSSCTTASIALCVGSDFLYIYAPEPPYMHHCYLNPVPLSLLKSCSCRREAQTFKIESHLAKGRLQASAIEMSFTVCGGLSKEFEQGNCFRIFAISFSVFLV